MAGRAAAEGTQLESTRPSAGFLGLEDEYSHAATALNRAGILTPLPRSGSPGVSGIDGQEYPLPSQQELQELLARNHELVNRKVRQGFTGLLLTPIAMPVSALLDRVSASVRTHAAAGKIIRTKRNPSDADVPIRVRAGEPIWIWERVRTALDTPDLVCFPRAFTRRDHLGYSKEEVIRDGRICAVPGWSVGLVEPVPIMPQPGLGRAMARRQQLETDATPRDYLRTLGTPAYCGETGWTLEDFLTHFATQLELTDQVSHDRCDCNALWLLGSYLPNSMPNALMVLTANWASDVGRRLYVAAHRSGNRLAAWGARSIVRLGG